MLVGDLGERKKPAASAARENNAFHQHSSIAKRATLYHNNRACYNRSAMKIYDWQSVAKEQLNPLFARQVIHSETMTIARVYLSKGCSVPEHKHHNEQISTVEQGSVRFVLDGNERIVKAG